MDCGLGILSSPRGLLNGPPAMLLSGGEEGAPGSPKPSSSVLSPPLPLLLLPSSLRRESLTRRLWGLRGDPRYEARGEDEDEGTIPGEDDCEEEDEIGRSDATSVTGLSHYGSDEDVGSAAQGSDDALLTDAIIKRIDKRRAGTNLQVAKQEPEPVPKEH